MKRHAALSDLEQVQRIIQPDLPPIDNAVTESPADDHAEHAVEEQIVDLLRLDDRPAFLRAATSQDPGGGKADDIHQPVPANGKRTYGKNDRVDFGVGQHGR